VGPNTFTVSDEYGFELDVRISITRIGGTAVTGFPDDVTGFGTGESLFLAWDATFQNGAIGESTNTATMEILSGGTPLATDGLSFEVNDIDAVDNFSTGDRCDFVTATGDAGNPSLSYVQTNPALRSVIIGPGNGSGSTGTIAANQAQCVFNVAQADPSPGSNGDDNGTILLTYPAGTSTATVAFEESIEDVYAFPGMDPAARGVGLFDVVVIEQDTSISLDKTALSTSYTAAGETLSYQFVITNTGDLPINTGQDIVINDDQIGQFVCGTISAPIAPGATHTCTADYTTTASDVTAGSVTNIATAGVGTPGQAFATRLQSNSDTVSVNLASPPVAGTIEWVDWTSPTNGTLCSGTITVTATSGGTTGFANNDDTFDNGDDVDGTTFTPEGTFDAVNVSGRADGSFAFSQPVTDPTLHFYQLDFNTLTFSLTGSQTVSLLSSNAGQASSSGPATCGVGLSGNALTGCNMNAGDQNTGPASPKAPDATAGPGELEGAGTLSFSGTFTSVSYTSNTTTGGDNTTRWAVGVDATTCGGGSAALNATKSVTVYTGSATNPDLYAIPGEDVIYAITVENTGTGPSDADTIELIDLMPPQMAFYTGTTPEFGGTVIDWNETGTGLSFTPATDLAYSNSTSGAPADFSACTYTPVGSYDPAVTYICFNPKGAMASGSEFTVSFRARIE